MVEMLRLEPGEVMLAAAHNDDLGAAAKAGLATAFFARRTEHGSGQTTDLRAEDTWDIVCDVIDRAPQRRTGRGPTLTAPAHASSVGRFRAGAL